MKKRDVVKHILGDKININAQSEAGDAFAPTNIALCKYWGKRDTELNLPVTSSLSISLPEKGAFTTASLRNTASDLIILNEKTLPPDSAFVTRVRDYLDLFKTNNKDWALQIEINMNIPVAAGLASSACGFASLVAALDNLFSWNLSKRELSILARLGSGSASRSLWNGFVKWHEGKKADGMDSYAEPLDMEWPDLCVGIISISDQEKPVSSRIAMQRTVETSLLYESWPQKVLIDMKLLESAIHDRNFSVLGSTAESNALAMHATMLSASPPVCYFLPETIATMHKVWDLRRQDCEVYFTEDAGANLKLLFLHADEARIKKIFPEMDVIQVF